MTENSEPEVDAIDLLGADATPEEIDKALGLTPADDGDDGDGDDSDDGEDLDGGGDGEGGGGDDSEEGFRADGQPDWLPAKFKNPREMAKSNAELEKKLGEKSGKKKGPLSIKKTGEEAGDGDGPRPLDQDHFNELGAEWYENDGKLTKETMAKLVDTYHATPEFITSLMQNQADKNAAADEAALVDAGISTGEEWNTIAQWGADNLPDDVAEGIDKMLQSSSQIQRGAAITKLKSLYDKSRGTDKERISGKSGGKTHLKPISSNSQLQEAMDDPLYFDEGPAGSKYRAEVDRRAVAGGMAG